MKSKYYYSTAQRAPEPQKNKYYYSAKYYYSTKYVYLTPPCNPLSTNHPVRGGIIFLGHLWGRIVEFFTDFFMVKSFRAAESNATSFGEKDGAELFFFFFFFRRGGPVPARVLSYCGCLVGLAQQVLLLLLRALSTVT